MVSAVVCFIMLLVTSSSHVTSESVRDAWAVLDRFSALTARDFNRGELNYVARAIGHISVKIFGKFGNFFKGDGPSQWQDDACI
jgi:hypothetical protein